MTWRATLSVPLFSAALTITVPAPAQESAAADRPQPRTSQQPATDAAADPPPNDAPRPTGQLGQLPPSNDPAAHAEAEPQFRQITRLLRTQVRNPQGQPLGHISEIVIEPRANSVNYAVLTTGETLGVGGEMHAVPWHALKPGAEEQVLLLSVSQEQLSRMTGFDEENWPDEGNHAFAPDKKTGAARRAPGAAEDQAGQLREPADAVHDQPDAAPQPDAAAPQDDDEAARLAQQRLRDAALEQDTAITPLDRQNFWAHRASKLIGVAIQDAQGEDLGAISDLILEARRGKIAYVIVAYGGTLGIGDKRAIVPWTALDLNRQQHVAALSADTRLLDQLAFEGEQLPDMTDQRWVQRTHGAFGEEPPAEVFGYSIEVEEQGRKAPDQQGNSSRSDQPRSTRPSQDPDTPSARDAERDDQPPAREPSTPSSGDMNSR